MARATISVEPPCPDHLIYDDHLDDFERGDVVRVRGMHGRWRFMRHVLNTRSESEWVTIFGPLKATKGGGFTAADQAQFHSVQPEKIRST